MTIGGAGVWSKSVPKSATVSNSRVDVAESSWLKCPVPCRLDIVLEGVLEGGE